MLAERPLLLGPEVRQGVYLTDEAERRLMWVAATFDGNVALENCRYPKLPLSVVPVKKLLKQRWRRVDPISTG